MATEENEVTVLSGDDLIFASCAVCKESIYSRYTMHKITPVKDNIYGFYWDCMCIDNYIHNYHEDSCDVCGSLKVNSPTSSSEEVKELQLISEVVRISSRVLTNPLEVLLYDDEVIKQNGYHFFVQGYAGSKVQDLGYDTIAVIRYDRSK